MIASRQARALQNLGCLGSLIHSDPVLGLCHLQAEVIVKKPQVTHLEHRRHIRHEHVIVTVVPAGDHQIIHVHPHNNPAVTSTPQIDDVLGVASLEAELDQRFIKLGVPSVWSLLKPVEGLDEMQHLVLVASEHEDGGHHA